MFFSFLLQLSANNTTESALYCYCSTSPDRSHRVWRTYMHVADWQHALAFRTMLLQHAEHPIFLLAPPRTKAVPVLCASVLKSRRKPWGSHWDFLWNFKGRSSLLWACERLFLCVSFEPVNLSFVATSGNYEVVWEASCWRQQGQLALLTDLRSCWCNADVSWQTCMQSMKTGDFRRTSMLRSPFLS